MSQSFTSFTSGTEHGSETEESVFKNPVSQAVAFTAGAISSTGLGNRIRNDYSNRYALIIDRSSFYNASPNESDSLGGVSAEDMVLQQTAAPGSNGLHTPSTDPFRQCLGAVWSYKNSLNSNETTSMVAFLDKQQDEANQAIIPNAYSNVSNTEIKFENASDIWSEVFGAGSHEDSLNLSRKATRVKIFFDADVLQSKLTFLSLLTNINRKNAINPFLNVFEKDGDWSQVYINQKDIVDSSSDLSISFRTSAYNVENLGAYRYDAVLSKENSLPMGELSVHGNSAWRHSDETYQMAIDGGASPEDLYESLNMWENITTDMISDVVDKGQMGAFYSWSKNGYAHDELFYNDSSFDMPTPMSPSALELTSETNKSILYVDAKPVYNYYSKYYEKATTKKTLTRAQDMGSGEQHPLYERQLPSIYSVPIESNETPAPLESVADGQFNFDSFGHKLLNGRVSRVILETNSKHYDHIILDQTSKEYIQKFDSIKKQFPFYVDFEFNTPTKKALTTLFNKSGITDLVIRAWISNVFPSSDSSVNTAEVSKSSPVGATQNSGYYNPQDSDPAYNSLPLLGDEEAKKTVPAICSSGIYSIKEKKSFFNLVAPQESEDSTMEGGILGNAGSEFYREFDLNKFLDGYIKYLYGADGVWTVTEDTGDDRFINAGEFEGISSVYLYEDFVKELYLPNTSDKTKVFSDPKDGGYKSIPTDSPAAAISAFAFIADYQKLAEQLTRSYEEILSKKLAYNETMFYRIEKRPIDSGDNIPSRVQNFWIPVPNDSDNPSDVMKYIDTQVKYEKEYLYSVYAYQIVVGSKYGFHFAPNPAVNEEDLPPGGVDKVMAYYNNHQESAISEGYLSATDLTYAGEAGTNSMYYKGTEYSQQDQDTQSAKRLTMFDVICESDVKLVEVPVYQKTVYVSDSPPAPPEVDIVPLRGKKNDIKINFYPGSIGYEMQPILIDYNNDVERFNAIRAAQDRSLKKLGASQHTKNQKDYVQPNLLFKSDDAPTQYEIYRVTQPPTSYNSFRNDSTTRKSTKTVIDAIEASSFTDKIDSNRKYYYIFRTIDIHGNPSNPSPVYQVEMVENSGVTYPVISVYEFPVGVQYQGSKTKSIKRYLKIEPNPMQGALNLHESMHVDEQDIQVKSVLGLKNIPTLGTKNKKVFSDDSSTNPVKFKFRIKSKHTGKILDLNVSFKSRVIENNDQIVSDGTTGKRPTEAGEIK